MRFRALLEGIALLITLWRRLRNVGSLFIGMLRESKRSCRTGSATPAAGSCSALLAEMARSEVELLRSVSIRGLEKRAAKG